MSCLHQVPPLKAQGAQLKKSVRAQSGWRTPRNPAFPNTAGPITHELRDCGSMHRAFRGSGLIILMLRSWEAPGPETISNWWPLTNEILVFSKGVSLIVQTTNKRQTPCPAVNGQHKTHSMEFWDLFFICLIMLYLGLLHSFLYRSLWFLGLCLYGISNVCVYGINKYLCVSWAFSLVLRLLFICFILL